MKPLSVYVHIPFCMKKCNYCDFLSAPATRERQEAYIAALCLEIEQEEKSYVNHVVQTIFIGGGTPSILTGEDISRIFRTLKQNYKFADNPEITIEVNPGTVTGEKLQDYRQAGINRLSIGLQSAMDNELRALGRIHNYSDFLNTYNDAVKSGFNNINIDLMSAIPEQTMDSYLATLHSVTELKPAPTHISAYSLIVEEGTPFYENTPELPDEDTERGLYKITNVFLAERGYHRYEISNYAKSGYECKHNQVYWRRGDYVGFGLGAASLVNNTRFSNSREFESYVNQTASNTIKVESRQVLTLQEQMEEFMFLGLRMMSGVSKREFENLFGQSIDQVYPELVEKLIGEGLLKRLTITETGDERIALTDFGIDVSNQVMAEFLLS